MPQIRKIVSISEDPSIRLFPHWVMRMNQLGHEGIPFVFILDFDLASPMVLTFAEAEERGIQFEIKNTYSQTGSSAAEIKDISWRSYPVSIQEYQIGFEKVKNAIQAGDTYLLNLCYATHLADIESLKDIYNSTQAPYKLYVKNKFVVFSPEQFVEIRDRVISTFPMKGTIDAGIANAEQILLEDIKEKEEHATVVDLLRNDLSIVAKNIQVKRFRYISEIRTSEKNLLQCSSEITGQLSEDYRSRLGSIFYSLLPAGSVTGAPKKKTVELIKEIEPMERGFYTGVFGVFDGENLDSGVMIRMIEKRGEEYYYRSGGGITYRSDMMQEYQEMIDKVYVPY